MTETNKPDAGSVTETRTVTVTREEGTSFAITLARSSAPDAPLVLVVPAMGLQARWYRHLLADLNEAGCHVAVAELRGHEVAGGRRPGRSYDFGYAELVADLARAVDALTEQGLPRPYLLGHSLGGHIAAVYAARHPDTVVGLILVAAGSVHWRLWSLRHLLLTQTIAVSARPLGHFPGDWVGFGAREASTQMRDWARFARNGHLAFGEPRRDHTTALAACDLPLLAVSLDGDTMAPRATVDGLGAMMPTTTLTRVHLDEPGNREQLHHLCWARDPRLVTPHISAWLAEQRHQRAEDRDGPSQRRRFPMPDRPPGSARQVPQRGGRT